MTEKRYLYQIVLDLFNIETQNEEVIEGLMLGAFYVGLFSGFVIAVLTNFLWW